MSKFKVSIDFEIYHAGQEVSAQDVMHLVEEKAKAAVLDIGKDRYVALSDISVYVTGEKK